MWTAISKFAKENGIKMSYVEHVPGIKDTNTDPYGVGVNSAGEEVNPYVNTGGYLLDLTDYGQRQPILFGLRDEIDVDMQDFKNMPFKFSASKIVSGKKTITVRPQSYRMGTYKSGNKLFNVFPEGKTKISKYLADKGISIETFVKQFIDQEEVKYKHIKDFLDDMREMYVYRIERVMDKDEIIPEIADERFAKVYENRLALIKRIKRQLRDEQDPKKTEELRSRLDTLKGQAKMLQDDNTRTFDALLQMMRNDVAAVKKILDSKTDRNSLDYAKRLISNYVDLLTRDFGDVVDSLDSATKEGILNFISEVTRLAENMNKHFLSIANAEVQRLTGKNQLKVEGLPVDANDINLAEGWAYDTRWNKNPIVQAITKIIRDAQAIISLRLGEFKAINKRLVKALHKAGYNYEFMLQTDINGKKTGLFVSRESAAYKEARKKASADVGEHLTFYAQNHTFTIDDAAWKQRENASMEYYINNNDIVLTDADIQNGVTYDTKVFRFASDMTLKKNPYVMKAILDRIAANPRRMTLSDKEFFLDFLERGGFYAEKMGDEYVHPLSMEAHTKWIDEKWTALQSMSKTDPRREFYDHWLTYINKGRRMRRDEDRYLPWNFIPEKYKPLGVLAKTNQFLHDNLGQRISKNKGEIDPDTGEVEKKIPMYMLNDTLSPENKSYDLGDVLEDFVKETLNYEEKSQIEEPANMLLTMLRQQRVYDTNPDGTVKRIGNKEQFKNGLSNSYIQAAHRLNASLYGETQEQEFVSDKLRFYTDDAKQKMKQLRAELDALDLTPAQKQVAVQYTSNQVPYDGADVKIAKYVDLANEYQQVRDSGRNFTGSKFANSLMFMTSIKYLGLNLFAGLGELLQGYTGLFTEAAGNRYFNDSEAASAMGIVMSALTPWDNPLKTRVQNVAKFFDTVGDIFHESEGRVKSKTEGWAFAQYKVANYGANTSYTIAMLKHEKVKDRQGVEHSVWDALNLNDGKASWNKDIDIELYTDSKPSQFLLSLIHKSDEVLALNRERKTFMDPIKVDSKMVGRILGQFKKNWMIGMFYNRFGAKREANLTSGQEFEGFYRTFWNTILAFPKIKDPVTGEERNDTSVRGLMTIAGNLLKYLWQFSTIGKKTGSLKPGQYDPLVEANLRKFMREFSFALTLWAAMIILSSMNGDDDRNPLRTYFINQIARLHRDVTTFMSTDSLSSFVKNPAPIVSSFSDYVQIFDSVLRSTVLGDPFNSEGDLRVWKATERNIPFVNQVHNLRTKFDQAILYGKY